MNRCMVMIYGVKLLSIPDFFPDPQKHREAQKISRMQTHLIITVVI